MARLDLDGLRAHPLRHETFEIGIDRPIPACCAIDARGHAAALPSPAMNSRRRIRDLPG
jgi:hypothetical protein